MLVYSFFKLLWGFLSLVSSSAGEMLLSWIKPVDFASLKHLLLFLLMKLFVVFRKNLSIN